LLEFTDNRLAGLLREVQEAINETDDPLTLWRLGVALKQLADASRGRGYDLQPNKANRSW
jgi:uncharacterized protein YfaS (alpha-2-macroglobulin family)